MEQHAVPQDITGFKFKLVGDMTLVQFGELASGMVMAYVVFSIPTYAVIKYPIAFLFALLGIGLAFVPIEERPMHVWIFNFFKSIYRPTYYIWKKNSVDFLQTPPTVTTPQTKNFTQPTPAVMPVKKAEEVPVPVPVPVSTLSVEELMKKREQQQKEPASQTMTIEELVKRREEMNTSRDQKDAISLSEAERKVNDLTEQNKNLLRQIDEIKNKLFAPSGQDISELNKNLDSLMEKKNKLASEIATVRDELTDARVAPLTNPTFQQPAATVRKAAKVVPLPVERQAIVSLTSIPNVVNGLVLDENSKPLDGAILIIKDANNNSIRALRTNKVGQFIASTPLSNGNYLIEVEKTNYNFDVWQITLSGELLEPLEIKAKGQEI